MSRFFDPVIGTAYHEPAEGRIKISDAEWQALLDEQTTGRPIAADASGNPINIDPPSATNRDVEFRRLQAYADPVIGSDRYFSEANRMQAAGEQGFEDVRATGLIRYAQIQSENPWVEVRG